jgi:hypothetical protein
MKRKQPPLKRQLTVPAATTTQTSTNKLPNAPIHFGMSADVGTAMIWPIGFKSRSKLKGHGAIPSSRKNIAPQQMSGESKTRR